MACVVCLCVCVKIFLFHICVSVMEFSLTMCVFVWTSTRVCMCMYEMMKGRKNEFVYARRSCVVVLRIFAEVLWVFMYILCICICLVYLYLCMWIWEASVVDMFIIECCGERISYVCKLKMSKCLNLLKVELSNSIFKGAVCRCIWFLHFLL